MSRSVLEKCKTNVDIRFTKFFKNNLRKPMSTFVSHFSETDLDIHFSKIRVFFLKRMSRSVTEKFETDVDIRFVKICDFLIHRGC